MGIPKRRTYLISKDFQGRFILRFVMTTTVWAVLSISLFTLIAQRKLNDVLYSPHINLRSTVDLLMPSALQAHVAALVLFTVILVLAIRALWKRLSGPLYSLKKDIIRIANGDLVDNVSLREEEEFQNLATMLDRMRSDLRGRFLAVKEGCDGLAEAIISLDRESAAGTPTPDRIAAVRQAASRVREALHGFTY